MLITAEGKFVQLPVLCSRATSFDVLVTRVSGCKRFCTSSSQHKAFFVNPAQFLAKRLLCQSNVLRGRLYLKVSLGERQPHLILTKPM